jgi:AbrB family transcriptional regulator, transcriptional pleiotropic regulator of transition state genes
VTSTGMARKVDDLGRIVLPVETRRLFNIRPGDALEIAVADGAILLRKLESGCVFCDARDALQEFKGKLVCLDCTGSLGPPGPGQPASGQPASGESSLSATP